MFLEDIRIGQKVKPISHTTFKNHEPCVHEPEHSVAYKKALARSQPFLYVVAMSMHNEKILCNSKPELGGDYFAEYDLEPWEDNNNNQL